MGIFEYDEEKHIEMERNEAEERLANLLTHLLDNGKVEEARKAATDKEFRNQLYTEYHIL